MALNSTSLSRRTMCSKRWGKTWSRYMLFRCCLHLGCRRIHQYSWLLRWNCTWTLPSPTITLSPPLSIQTECETRSVTSRFLIGWRAVKRGHKVHSRGEPEGKGCRLFSLSERRKEHSWSGVGLSRELVTVSVMCVNLMRCVTVSWPGCVLFK